jgi:bla regulator protein BlaR1
MMHVAHFISNQVGRPVLDATGLSGRYAMTLSWYRPRPATAPEDFFGPSIFEAVQDQLGLRLQPAKRPVEMIVIDRIEKKPIEN